MTDVSAIIDELEREILAKKNIFGKCTVDHVKVTAIPSQLREAIPDTFFEAQTLLRQRDAIIEDAERKADAIIANANETRERMIHDSEVLAAARQQAADIEAQTQTYCQDLRISVHQSLDKQLYDIAVKMNEMMMTIESLREEFWKRSGGGQN